jgi:uncharacterized membrane protein
MIYFICFAAFLIFAIAPRYLTKAVHKLKVSHILSDVVICYIVGMIIGNTKRFWLTNVDDAATLLHFSEAVANYTVLLALPILIISTQISDIIRNIRPVFFAFALMVVCMSSSIIFASWYYQGSLQDGHKAAGMLAAVYTGGTPNMLSVAKGLDVSTDLLAIIQATDILCSGIFIVFLTSVARSFYGWFMPPYMPNKINLASAGTLDENELAKAQEELTPEELQILALVEELKTATVRRRIIEFLKSAAIAVLIIGCSTAMAILIPNDRGEMNQIVLMMTLTTLGVAVSGFFGKTTSSWITTTESANYVLLIFAVAAGSMADFAVIAEKGAGFIGFNAMIFATAMLLHFICGVIFRIKVDVLMISATASIFGPGFIPQLSYVLGHNRLLAAGIAAGILGFIIANYIGFGVVAYTQDWYAVVPLPAAN